MAAMPHRTKGGVQQISSRAVEVAAGSGASVHYDAHRGLWVAADARLRAQLIAEGWVRWGAALPGHLDGSFAFVVTDGALLFAARDAFGMRPLFYHASRERIAFATEVAALLALPDVSRDIHDGSILEYLLRTWDTGAGTYFRGVQRVLPGHTLTVRKGGSPASVRFFVPPEPIEKIDERACDAEFKRLFFSAVEARLETKAPIVALLSGGLDSSSIACVADAIYARSPDRPPLHLASAVFPGLDTDERIFIDAVRARVRFASERFDATRAEPFAWKPCPFHPDRSHQLPIAAGWRRIAIREGAHVVLSGMGGDELLFERGVFRDLALDRRFVALFREAWLAPRYSTYSTRFYIEDGLRALAPPLLRSAERFIRSARAKKPAWMTDALWKLRADRRTAPSFSGENTRSWTWDWLTHTRLTWNIESDELAAAAAGLEVRYPFLDPDLARFVLALPYELRLPGGGMKILLRRALSAELPPEIRTRTHVTTFDAFLRSYYAAQRGFMSDVLSRGPWASAGYVLRAEAQRAFESGDLSTAWPLVMLECWLRALIDL
jgi:asparagine synthase (glutamine-hydrolysing)